MRATHPEEQKQAAVCLCSKNGSDSCKNAAVHTDTADTTSAEAMGDSHADPAEQQHYLCCSGQGMTTFKFAQCHFDYNVSRTLTPTASKENTKHSIHCALYLLKKSCPVHV